MSKIRPIELNHRERLLLVEGLECKIRDFGYRVPGDMTDEELEDMEEEKTELLRLMFRLLSAKDRRAKMKELGLTQLP